jgi:hypothetical protein
MRLSNGCSKRLRILLFKQNSSKFLELLAVLEGNTSSEIVVFECGNFQAGYVGFVIFKGFLLHFWTLYDPTGLRSVRDGVNELDNPNKSVGFLR